MTYLSVGARKNNSRKISFNKNEVAFQNVLLAIVRDSFRLESCSVNALNASYSAANAAASDSAAAAAVAATEVVSQSLMPRQLLR